jgi:hypothetical protein
MEVDGMDEILLDAEAASCVFDPLNLGIERFAGRVGNRLA